jgi:hypothetical protein
MPKSEAEEWRAVPGYEGTYEVSSWGRVRSINRWLVNKHKRPFYRKGILLKAVLNKPTPYYKVVLYAKGSTGPGRPMYVHQVVASAFTGPCPVCREVRHLDGNPRNNHVGNLAYGTQLENSGDSIRLGTTMRGSRNGCSRLTEEIVASARALVAAKKSTPTTLAKKYRVATTTMCDALTGKTWGHVAVPVVQPKYTHHLTEQDYEDIRRKYHENGKVQRELAEEYNVSAPNISRIISAGKSM